MMKLLYFKVNLAKIMLILTSITQLFMYYVIIYKLHIFYKILVINYQDYELRIYTKIWNCQVIYTSSKKLFSYFFFVILYYVYSLVFSILTYNHEFYLS